MMAHLTAPSQRRTTAPKFISAILVLLYLSHTKTKENQTNSEPQALISEIKYSV